MKYGPFICIAVVLAILFVIWAFWGGKDYEFVGLAPLSPDTCGSYTGSVYNWGNITPATGYDPIEGHNCVPPDGGCVQETFDPINQTSHPPIVVDNTPSISSNWSRDQNNLISSSRQTANSEIYIAENSLNDIDQEISLTETLINGNNILDTIDNSNILDTVNDNNVLIDDCPVCPQEADISNVKTINPLINNDINVIMNPLNNDNKLIDDGNKHITGVPLILDYDPRSVSAPRQHFLPRNLQLSQINNPKPKSRGRFISRGERQCCQTLERIYGVPFTSTWPDWLRNPETGETLELDCYNDDLKLAVEYNGEQHYKWPNFTNQSYQQFINQVRRDRLKVDICDRNGVYLISVPYNVSYDLIPSYIISHLPETIQKRLREEKVISQL
jgi:hypothetical protein